ncbi:MAG: serine/threonine-protein kinase [Pirellulales bacterium]
MSIDLPRLKQIFLEAADIADIEKRAQYLESACAGDATLRLRLQALLDVHEREDRLLDKPVYVLVGGSASASSSEPLDADASREFKIDFLEPSRNAKSQGRLAHYEVSEVLGQGGMSVVFRAFDEKLQRAVAIKALAPQLATTDAARSRFVREARAAAAVTHENVIAIYAVEDAGPVPYLVMQYVQGRTLQQKLDAVGPLAVEEIVRIGMQIAAGLAAAHRQGLIHRDIKPANILLEDGEERVRITDFGLARAADDASLTRSGHIAGTPLYMSPEQAEGEAVDARSDLFSLGSVLYALATGHPPFRASTPLAVLKRVSEDAPRAIREVNPAIPAWLENIIARLHAKDPAQRFQTAAELSRRFEKCLAQMRAGQTPLETPFSNTKPQAGSWLTTSKAARAAVTLLAAIAVIGAGAGVLMRLSPAELPARPPLGTSPQSPPAGWSPPPIPTSEQLAQRPSPLDAWQADDLSTAVWRARRVGDSLPAGVAAVLADRRHLVPEPNRAHWLSKSNDEQRLAAPMGEVVLLYDASGRLVQRLSGHEGRAFRGDFSHDGRYFACGSSLGELRVWDCRTGETAASFATSLSDLWTTVFSADDRRIVVSGSRGIVEVFEWRDGGSSTLAQFDDGIEQLVFSDDGRLLAGAGLNGVVRVWSWEKGELVQVLREHDGRVRGAAFSADGKRFAAADEQRVVVWNVEDWQILRSIESPGGGALGFTADGTELAAAPHEVGADRPFGAVWWNLDDGAKVGRRELPELVRGALFGCVARDGRSVFALSSEVDRPYIVRLSIDEPLVKETSTGHQGLVLTVDVSPDGRWLASGDTNSQAFLWDLADASLPSTGAPTHVLAGHEREVWCAKFSPDSRRLATGSIDGLLRIWDVASGRLERELSGYSSEPALLTFSPDGRMLAAGGRTGEVNVWDVESGQPAAPIRWHVGVVRPVAFSRDGKWLASGGEDKTVQLIETATGRRVRSFRGRSQFTSLAFTPDESHLLATSDRSGPTLWVWNLQTGAAQSIEGHLGHSLGIALHPSGKTFATSGWDGLVNLWQWSEPPQKTNSMPLVQPNGLVYSPEGRHLVVGMSQGLIVVLRPSDLPAPDETPPTPTPTPR